MDYDFVEYLKTFKYTTDFDYEKIDKSKNVITSKIRRNNEVIYKPSTEVRPAKFKQELDSLNTKIKFKTDFLKIIQEKKLSGYLTLNVTIDEKGRVKDSQITSGEYNEVVTIILKELFDSLNWIPAKHNERNVKSITNITAEYYDEELYLNSSSFSKSNNIGIQTTIETMPEYPGGMTEMMKYITKNLKFPEIAKKVGLTGKCYLKFVVLPNGSITNVTVIKGIAGCSECDQEAVRVVKSMPKWKPSTQNGKPVSTFYNLPINFQLK
jgi:TonB family protein